MQNRIPAAALLAALGIFASCSPNVSRTANFGTAASTLAYGVYTATTLDSGLSVKLSLNQNGSYSKKKFRGSCFIIEYKGDWKSDNEAIAFSLREVRSRPDCHTEDWQSVKAERSSSRLVRSVTTTSFELLDQGESVSAHWIRFVKR